MRELWIWKHYDDRTHVVLFRSADDVTEWLLHASKDDCEWVFATHLDRVKNWLRKRAAQSRALRNPVNSS